MNSSGKMKQLNVKVKTMIKFLVTILSVFLVKGCAIDYVDTIEVKNNSEYKIHVLINENYPDTSLEKAYVSSFINPKADGTVGLVNKNWEELLQEKDKVTIFFVEWKPADFYESGRPGGQQMYGKLTLSQAKLDSLGGEIVFPDDVTQNGM